MHMWTIAISKGKDLKGQSKVHSRSKNYLQWKKKQSQEDKKKIHVLQNKAGSMRATPPWHAKDGWDMAEKLVELKH